MSKRFLTKLAGGAVLGSAALLFAAPVAAFAASDGPTKEPRNSNQEWEWKRDSNDDRRGDDRRGDDRRGDDRRADDRRGEDRRGEDRRGDDKRKKVELRDNEGNGVTCGNVNQDAEASVGQRISDNIVLERNNRFEQDGAAAATNENNQEVVVCIRDIEVDVEEVDNLLDAAEAASTGRVGSLGQGGGVPGLNGVYAGPEGAFVLPSRAS